MSLTAPDIARDRIERFVARFGAPYRRLAWYAALPLILTPELLGYLRTAFVGGRDGCDWIAEADLLLSDLCRPVGDEQYALDQALRACLLDEMRDQLGEGPMREAAQLLLRYVRHLCPGGAGLRAEELEAEQWSAMAYLDEHRGEAVRQIAAALGAGLMPPAPGAAAVGISAAELARLVELTEELSPKLAAHPQLLDYARVVAGLLSAPERLRDLGERLAAGEALPMRWVDGVQVPDPSGRSGPGGGSAGPDSPIPFRDPFLDGSGDGPELVWLPGGTFRMGSPPGVGDDDERPAHRVQLGHYAVGKYPVTVGEFRRFVQATGYRTEAEGGGGATVFDRKRDRWESKSDANWRKPYMEQDDRHPVVCISWNDARAYCDWLGKATGQRYALLTEAQWEHACRAGRDSRWCYGDDEHRLGDYAWYRDNAGKTTHPVGEKLANAWGLHDLHGNVWEWCQDWWADSYAGQTASGVRSDGQSARTRASGAAVAASDARAAASSGEQPLAVDGPKSGSYRVVRGGAWNRDADYCRSAYRNRWHPADRIVDLGFRLSRTGPLHSYPFTLGRAEPPVVAGAPVRSGRAAFAPYEVFSDRLDLAGAAGAAGPELVYLPGGAFEMGDEQGYEAEKPVHPVRVSAFALGRTPVTWGQYRAFCEATGAHWPEWLEPGSKYHLETGTNDYYAKRGISRQALDLPVVGVCWDDARAYCDWLSAHTGKRYALPTEAQWEYACRAGTRTRWSCGDDPKRLRDFAWFSENAGGRLQPVGRKPANDWGLYDMHGNCWEWCADWYASDYYQKRAKALRAGTSSGEQTASGREQDASIWRRLASMLGFGASDAAVAASAVQQPAIMDPIGPESGSNRVVRGGAWINDADYCRSASRNCRPPAGRDDVLGFRLSRTV